MSKVVKQSVIKMEIGLNKDKLPEQIMWQSSDQKDNDLPQECKAMLLSLFDKESKDTLKIDLWTTEMQVVEMDRFMFQTLRGMAESYFRATGNKLLYNDMQLFVDYFGKQTGIISEDKLT